MFDLNPTELLDVAQSAARDAGKLLVDMQHGVTSREKGPKDLVTEADLAAQKLIEQRIRECFPSHEFIGEESPDALSRVATTSTGYCWLVDPLDGTANYAHGLPSYSVSIALVYNGRVELGVVYDPNLNECYHALRGRGAWLNGKAIRTSECEHLAAAMVVASFAADIPRGSPEIARFVEVLHAAQSVRRLGSAALNLCYVAAGRLDAYWASSVKAWDVAAGQLLVTEAGGHLTALNGAPFQLTEPNLIAAATRPLHSELKSVLDRVQ